MKDSINSLFHRSYKLAILLLLLLAIISVAAISIYQTQYQVRQIQNTKAAELAKIYYISTQGSNSNDGMSQEKAFQTIQKCLDIVLPGETCTVLPGIYEELLTLKNTGIESSPITLTCTNNKECTVTSPAISTTPIKTLITGKKIDYYIIDGFRFLAPSGYKPADQMDFSIDLGKNTPWSTSSKTNGNNGFIIRNSYIEGSLHFYGHNNLVENTELNGRGAYSNAITDNYAASYNNTYRKNIIYNYIVRGIWTMESTDNIVIEDNIIHDVRHGVDCDGANIAITRCLVTNNTLYNHGVDEWGSGVFFENCFECTISGNTIHDIKNGPGIFTINYGNGSSKGWYTYNKVEYRNRESKTTITNNIIYNYLSAAGMYIEAVNGLIIDHNTLYTTSGTPPIGFHAEADVAGTVYHPSNETITNNIFYSGSINWFTTITRNLVLTNNFSGNPSFINPPSDLHLQINSPACTAGVGGSHTGAYQCTTVTALPSPTNTPTSTAVPPSPTTTPTSIPTLIPTVIPTLVPSLTPTQIPTQPPTAVSTYLPTPTPIKSAESIIVIYAGGTKCDGVYPSMQLLIDNRAVATWDNINANGRKRQTKEYSYKSPTPITANNKIMIHFINDKNNRKEDRNLFVDKIVVDGVIKETESPSIYSSGSWAKDTGCKRGFKQTEWLHCRGSFFF